MQMSRLVSALVVLFLLAAPRPLWAGGDWNDAEIKWQAYDEGLNVAKEAKKPVCLIFYTDWCPHCQNYSKVFHDPKVVEQAKRFVMIRINKDQAADVSRKYVPDGEYIPRTYFLSAAGALEPAIHAPREQFKYFYDESNPAGVLAGMNEALQKLQ